jgi:hypothetical protein
VAVGAHLVGGSATFGADCPSSREEFEQRKHGFHRESRRVSSRGRLLDLSATLIQTIAQEFQHPEHVLVPHEYRHLVQRPPPPHLSQPRVEPPDLVGVLEADLLPGV